MEPETRVFFASAAISETGDTSGPAIPTCMPRSSQAPEASLTEHFYMASDSADNPRFVVRNAGTGGQWPALREQA